MQRYKLMVVVVLILLGFSRQATANCTVIDQLDKLYVLQTRLANNPATALFRDDIRQLRTISQLVSDQDTLRAVEGNSFVGKGASFVQFLQNTQRLLQGASLDDPFSVQGHFNGAARQNLRSIGGYLNDLRCTDTQIAIDAAERAADPTRGNSDAEDIREVIAFLNQLAEEVFQWRTLFIVLTVTAVVAVAKPLIRRWIVIRQRRAKRHTTHYVTQYAWADRSYDGMLMDINCYGTKLLHAAGHPLPNGTPLDVAIEGQMTSGTVMWSNVHYSGVKFDTSIDLAHVYAVCAAGQ